MSDKKFFNGTVELFKSFMHNLSQMAVDQPEYANYLDLKNSVIYISENFNSSINELTNFTGAIYANGAIIAGSSNKSTELDEDWIDDVTEIEEEEETSEDIEEEEESTEDVENDAEPTE